MKTFLKQRKQNYMTGVLSFKKKQIIIFLKIKICFDPRMKLLVISSISLNFAHEHFFQIVIEEALVCYQDYLLTRPLKIRFNTIRENSNVRTKAFI